jgi:hypothetical protein
MQPPRVRDRRASSTGIPNSAAVVCALCLIHAFEANTAIRRPPPPGSTYSTGITSRSSGSPMTTRLVRSDAVP